MKLKEYMKQNLRLGKLESYIGGSDTGEYKWEIIFKPFDDKDEGEFKIEMDGEIIFEGYKKELVELIQQLKNFVELTEKEIK